MANAKQYFENLCKEAGLDEATTSALIQATSNEKLSPKLEQLVKTATEDYQAQVGRVAALTAKEKEYQAWYGTASSQYKAIQDELEALKASGGTPSMDFDTSKFVSKDDMLQMQKQMGTRFGTMLKQVGKISSRHAAKFGEELDTDALEALCESSGLPLDLAYEKMIEPRVKEAAEKSVEARIKAAREDERKQVLSTHRLPIDPTPRQVSPMYARAQADNMPMSATDDELMSAWNGQPA